MSDASKPAREIGFGHSYPARECPEVANPSGWETGYRTGLAEAENMPPDRNPFTPGSDEWRGFEAGVSETGV